MDSGDGKFPTVHQFDVQTEILLNDAIRARPLSSLFALFASASTH